MTCQVLGRGNRKLAFALLSLAPLMATTASAQSVGQKLRAAEPELAEIIDAAYIAQAEMFSEISAIDNSPATRDARDRFEQSLTMRANMSMAQMMAMMRMDPSLQHPGPFDELESSVSAEMLKLLRTQHSRAEVRNAYDDSPLPERVVEVIRGGRLFETRIYEVLTDTSIDDKAAALTQAVEEYSSADSSVPLQPKPAGLLLDHPHAGAFAEAYPKLSSVLWSTQWLQLAGLEAMVLQEQGPYYWGSLETVLERYRNKLRDSSSSPLPVELPMAPAIAPTLFTLTPEAAVILDNLNMFETVVADVLAFPNLANKTDVLNSLVDEFTDHSGNFDTTLDYLVSALRGGIYNQGGPAIGELQSSERNRSRMEMGMQHAMIMSNP